MKEACEYDFVFHACEDKTVNNLIHKFSNRAIESNKKHGDKIHEVDRPTIEWLTEALEEAMGSAAANGAFERINDYNMDNPEDA